MFELLTRIDLAGARPDARRPGAAIVRGALGLLFGFAVLATPTSHQGLEAAESELREVLVGVPRSYPPQYSVDSAGNPVGFAIDVIEEIAALAGLRMTYLVMDNLADLNTAVNAGDIDFVPNYGITPERAATTDFTAPVETVVVSIFVREDNIDINSAADLRGRMVGVVETNVGRRLMKKRDDIILVAYQDADSALFSLVAGHVDAVVFPKPVFLKLARIGGIADHIKVAGPPLKEIKRGIRVKKGEPELLAALNQAVHDFVGTPAYQKIYVKWYGQQPSFWTATRALAATGLVILLVLIVMGWWRLRSVVELSRELRETIAARDSAVREFQISEARFRAFIEHSPNEIHLKDTAGRFILINKLAEKMFGMTDAEIRGKTSYDILAKDMADAFAGLDVAVLKSGKTCSHEKEFRNGDRSQILRVVKFPIKDAAGEIVAVGAISSDITEFQQVSEALVKSEARLQQAVRLTRVGHRVWDVVGAKTIYCSDEHARIHGVSAAEYLAQADSLEGVAEFAHPEDRGGFRSVMLALLADGLEYELEYRLQLPGGEIRYVREFGLPVFGDNGNLIELHGTLQDITKTKQAGEHHRHVQNEAAAQGG